MFQTYGSLAVTGGTEVYKEREQLRAIDRGLLIATPGRLLDHIRNGAVDLSAGSTRCSSMKRTRCWIWALEMSLTKFSPIFPREEVYI